MKQGLTSPRLAALGSMVLLVIAALVFDWEQTKRVREEYRQEALQELGVMRTSMTQILNEPVHLSASIAQAIAAQEQVTPAKFQTLITELLQLHSNVAGVDIFEGSTLQYRYRSTDELNLPPIQEIPDQPTIQAIPQANGQGYWLQVVMPITADQTAATQAVILVADFKSVLDRSAFTDNFEEFDYLLLDPLNSESRDRPFLGDAEVFKQRPVSGDIHLGDQTWQLLAVPTSGWDITPEFRSATRLLSVLLTLSTGGVVWLVLSLSRWQHTAIRRAVADLEQREQAYRSIVEQANTIIIRVSDTGTIELFNQCAQNILGRDAASVVGQSIATVLTAPDRAYLVQESLRNSLRNGYEERDIACVRGSGEIVWIAWSFKALRDRDGQPLGAIVTGFDVSQRCQQEQALRRSETELTALIEAMNDAIFVMDRNGTYVRIVPTRTNLIHDVDELLGKTVLDVLGERSGQDVLERLQMCLDRQQTLEFEYGVTINNQNLWLDAMASPLEAGLAILVVRDVSKRHSTEDELRQAKAELEARVAARAGEIHEANKNLQREVVERMQIEDALRQSEEREREKATQLETTLQELKRTQAQLVQTEKMSSLGQLAAGMAHEINNPVNFIHGNIRPIRDYTNDLLELIELFNQEYPETNEAIDDFMEEIDLAFLQDDLNKALDSMQSGTERIRSIIKSLQNFARLDEMGMKRVNLLDGIHSALAVLRSRFKANSKRPLIDVVCELNELPPVMCYPSQINQVVINLLDNAIDALEECYAGSGSPPTDPPQITLRTQLWEHDSVCISIADNANGMAPEIVECIFNPFFTTKPVGQGTGLGLSVAYQNVHENHDGQLLCQSIVGQGTEFRVVLPISNQEKVRIQQSTESTSEEAVNEN